MSSAGAAAARPGSWRPGRLCAGQAQGEPAGPKPHAGAHTAPPGQRRQVRRSLHGYLLVQMSIYSPP